MEAIAGLTYFPFEITKDGKVFSAPQTSAIEAAVNEAGANKLTDLFVVSHGWNNDKAEARELYNELFTNIAALLPNHGPLSNRKFAIVGVLWPSKKFADADLIPSGGAVSIGNGGQDVAAPALKAKLESLKGTFDKPDTAALDKAKALVDGLDDSESKQKEFVEAIRSVLPNNPSDARDDASDKFFTHPAATLLKKLALPSTFPVATTGGTTFGLSMENATGSAAGLGDLFSGMKAAAWRLLNYATYYQMKERAGVVGKGLNDVLKSVRQSRPDLRIHLIGHSFGARVVTAAVDGPAELKPASMCLLQGAFSHNGFTEKFDGRTDGFFRKVVSQSKVNGPIVATYTVNDRAVGIAYPIASRISFDNRSALGDKNDVFGGIGRNGAVNMKPNEVLNGQLGADTATYDFTTRKVNNLQADAFVYERLGLDLASSSRVTENC